MLVMLMSVQVFSEESSQNTTELKEPKIRYGGGIGIPFYDTLEGESNIFSGTSLYFSWSENEKSNQVILRESVHGLEVLSPINGKHVQKNWDIEYSWDVLGRWSKKHHVYIAPILGGKVKEDLTVKCRKQREVCFDSYMSDWKITDTKQKILPIIGLNTGFRLIMYKSHIVANTNLFLKTDLEDTYYGMEISLGLQQ
jgi:hypothetical protein